MFRAQAARTPEAPALVHGAETWSYAALAARADALARRLRAAGVGPEVPVGVFLERSAGMVAALLAVLEAGGAYVPLDPGYPPERLRWMLEDARVPVLITEEPLLARLPAYRGATLCLDALPPLPAAEDDPLPPAAVHPDNLAYVVYTSGTTGRPKGVCATHRAVVRLVRDPGYVAVGADDVFLQFAPVSFDAATFEIWTPLLNGARLAVMPSGAAGLDDLGRAIREHGVTVLWLTAGLFHLMVDERPGDLRSVRQLLAGGDVVSPSHVRRVLEHLPGCRLINGYGPTESTTFACCHTLAHPDEVGQSVPIGTPIDETVAHVLDGGLRPEDEGELYVGGAGLARGYLGRPALTAERFVPSPSGPAGARLYRTGDRVRRLPGGALDFLGRVDDQVKVRGFRVEPAEVECVLQEHPGVRRAAVAVVHDPSGAVRLAAFVVPEGAASTSPAGLVEWLAARLPEPMVPATVTAVDALPLTPNGKVDRGALATLARPGGPPRGGPDGSARSGVPDPYRPPAAGVAGVPEDVAAGAGRRLQDVAPRSGAAALSPEIAGPPPAAAGFRAPAGEVEERVAAIWRELLERDRVGADENFFDAGGDSLLGMRVVGRVRTAFGVELPIRVLAEAPTVAGIAGWVDRERGRATVPAGAIPAVERGERTLEELLAGVAGLSDDEVKRMLEENAGGAASHE